MSWLLSAFLDWLWGKLSSLLSALWLKKTTEEKIDQEAKDSVEPLKNAQTAEEIDKAADDALNHF